MGSQSWLNERTKVVLAGDWASIKGCKIRDIERSEFDFRLIAWIVLMFFGLALFVALGLPFLFEQVNTLIALVSASILTVIGLVLLNRAPRLHSEFKRDAIELTHSLYSINPYYRTTYMWTNRTLQQLAHSIYINQIGRDRCIGPENDLAQLDALLKEMRGQFDRLHAIASKFWRMETKDSYHQHAPTRRHLGEE